MERRKPLIIYKIQSTGNILLFNTNYDCTYKSNLYFLLYDVIIVYELRFFFVLANVLIKLS